MKRTYFIKTFGCQMNEYDSELVAGQLQELGLSEASKMEEADLILVNTCSVRALAEQKALSELGMFAVLKRKSKKRKIFYGVIGCLAEHKGRKFLAKFWDIDLIVGPSHERNFKELVREALAGEGPVIALGEAVQDFSKDVSILRKSKNGAWVTVSKGCNSFCSYCIVPYLRGKEESRSLKSILKEVKLLIEEGYKEITLIGQNVNTYGKDLKDGKYDFSDLLKAIEAIPGKFWVRFYTSHPKDIPEKLMDTVAGAKKICPHFHLPIQSGSDRILKLMNRHYTRSDYLEIVRKLRERVNDVALSTDIIVGFPGETEADFKETMDLYAAANYDAAYTYKYSPRQGTKSFELEDDVSSQKKGERLKALMAMQRIVSSKVNNKLVGTIREVLLDNEQPKEHELTGRDKGNKPVFIKYAGKKQEGYFIKVRIVKANPFSLVAELVD